MKAKSRYSRCQSALQLPAQFCHKLAVAISNLKGQLYEKFEQSYPGRGHLIRQAVSEAEELAWETTFPHLFLPDFAEVRMAEIVAAREPAFARAA